MSNHKKGAVPQIKREKTEDFIERYANYTYLQSTMWDIKCQFGQAETDGGSTVPIDTAVTLPWAQAKVLAYFLRIHIQGFETSNGRIKIPRGIIPKVDEASPFRYIFDEFIKQNPEANPEGTNIES
jgi:hypothetical protein